MYGCLTHCIGPGCDFWNICEQLCSDPINICPRCDVIENSSVSLTCEQKNLVCQPAKLTLQS